MDDIEQKAAKQIGRAVRSCRSRAGWSQAVLAEKLDLSVEYVSFLERGERLPAVGTLIRLSRAFRLPIGALFGETAIPNEEKDPLVALLESVPAAALPAVRGMLRGVIREYRRGRASRG
jgi:transcriptional regulator with XRE-family HTH domain